MGRYLNVHEALKILNDHYVTDSIKMVTRWIREGKIPAERTENRKEGWRIEEGDLFDFITAHNPGIVQYIDNYRMHNGIVPIGEIGKDDNLATENGLNDKKNEPQIREDIYLKHEEVIGELKIKLENVLFRIEEKDAKAIDNDKEIQDLKKQINEVKDSLKITIREEMRAAISDMKKSMNESSLESEKTNGEKKRTENREAKNNITPKKFREYCSKVLSDEELIFYESDIDKYYKVLVENNRVKDIHFDREGNICCPFDKEKKIKHIYPGVMIKEGVRKFINSLADVGDPKAGDEESDSSDGNTQPEGKSTFKTVPNNF